MMKYFLVFLFGVISTFCSAQVNISREASLYHIEAVEYNKVLNAELAEAYIQIRYIQEQSALKDQKLADKKVVYTESMKFKDNQITDCENEKKILRREIRRQKFQKVVIMVGSVVVIILVAI